MLLLAADLLQVKHAELVLHSVRRLICGAKLTEVSSLEEPLLKKEKKKKAPLTTKLQEEHINNNPSLCRQTGHQNLTLSKLNTKKTKKLGWTLVSTLLRDYKYGFNVWSLQFKKKLSSTFFCNYTNLKWTFYSLRISEAQTEVFTEFKDAIQKWKQNQPTKNSSDINISSNCIFPCSSHLLLQGFLHCLIL